MASPTEPVSAIEKRAPLLLGIAFVSLLGLLFATYTYRTYHAAQSRPPPGLPRCALGLSITLQTEETVSAAEPHIGPNGETIYLRPNEEKAVACVTLFERDLAKPLAGAFAETDPEKRGRAFIAVAKAAPPGVPGDKWAYAAFMLGSGSLKSSPKTPAIKALADELEQVHACRFDTATVCATRPPEPLRIWLIGVPAGVGVGAPFLLFAGEGIRRLLAWRKKQKSKPAAA